ncbi:MAG: hypothetical protein NTX50_26910 [Candidatus Sumerlaeota bacterium]|nr:hypothetical protein [Candidatus Sumerlaeota bacterium]
MGKIRDSPTDSWNGALTPNASAMSLAFWIYADASNDSAPRSVHSKFNSACDKTGFRCARHWNV